MKPGSNVHRRKVAEMKKQRPKSAGTCPDCGAGKEKRQAALGGTSYCMQCGHEFREGGQ